MAIPDRAFDHLEILDLDNLSIATGPIGYPKRDR